MAWRTIGVWMANAATTCGIVWALSVGPFAQASVGRGSGLSAEDHLAILELYDDYTWNVDVGNDAVEAVFTEDGSFETTPGGRRTTGRAQLQAMYSNLQKNRARNTRHLLSNISVRATADGAAGRAYMFTVDGRDGNRPVMTQFGRYEDRLVKTVEGWRFRQRVFHFDVNLPRTPERP